MLWLLVLQLGHGFNCRAVTVATAATTTATGNGHCLGSSHNRRGGFSLLDLGDAEPGNGIRWRTTGGRGRR